ncbi:hypothetical protein RNJ44_02943 [Nakaseomyces bracarensis]|uniref:Protein CMS1 n=1 Tax=Nakaseomyces bracarensis TaxID=273131 RepID=A0ABR4P0S1_9SACH
MVHGDDLEDDFVLDETVDVSAAEEYALEEEEENSNKRTADDKEDDEERPLSKRQKKLQKRGKLSQKKKELVEYETTKKKSIPKSTPEEIADYFASLIRDKNPDLSAIELQDMYLKKSDFLSTEKYDETRNLNNFPAFMTQFSRAPRAIVFSMSNIRVADVFRSLEGSKQCVKLFAKNKLKDDVKSVEEVLSGSNKKMSKIKYFVSTPTRMEKILETTEALFQGKEKLDIILDASYLDPKNNSLISFENTLILCKVLKTIMEKKSSVKILLY